MKKSVASIVIILIIVSLSMSKIIEAQSESKKIDAEGAIVAFQKGNRHRAKPETKDIGTYVEFWIIRIDRWADGVARDEKYILVEYKLYERGLSDSEINSGKLKFVLRERREDEHTDCMGTILVSDKPPYTTRPIELSDYERTEPGKFDNIPSLQSLPCLIADQPPVIIK